MPVEFGWFFNKEDFMEQQQPQGAMPITSNELLQMIGEQAVEIRVLRRQVQDLAAALREGQEARSSKGEAEG
jgi:hypothetical protein